MKTKRFFTTIAILFAFISFFCSSQSPADDPELAGLDEDDQQLVAAVEAHRINAINKVIGSVIAIYDEDRQGGGSGVIIDPTGIALTNHHVIMGAGVEGWGGLADGKMYK
jgi:S1-C subfamily serine protease